MNILIVSATKIEIEDFINKNPEANILITGVGIALSTYSITKCLLKNKYDIIIQAGIAGGFSNSYPLASVVIVKTEIFGTSGIKENKQFFTLEEKGLLPADDIFEGDILINKNPLLDEFNYPKVKGVTVDIVTDESFDNCVIKTKFSPDVESMEGAVLHYVCLKENVSFLQLRSISNFVGERNKEKWKFKESVFSLNEALQNIYNSLKDKYAI